MKSSFSSTRFWGGVVVGLCILFVQLACSLSLGASATSTPDSPTALLPTLPRGEPPTTIPTAPAPARYTLREDLAVSIFGPANASTEVPADVSALIPPPPPWGFEGFYCSKEYPAPAVDGSPASFPVFSHLTAVVTCGWKNKEEVKIVVRAPDGNTEVTTQTYDADLGAAIALAVEPKPGALLGTYQARFSGPSGEVEVAYQVIPPVGPDMEKLENGRLFLFGFTPGEDIRLFAYLPTADPNTYSLKGWQAFKTDAKGELLVENQFPEILVIAVSAEGKEFNPSISGPAIHILKGGG